MTNLLSMNAVEALGGLDIYARVVVDGYLAGRHRSLSNGSGSEFVQYRNYIPGDDPRLIDWKAYGRSRKLLSRVYREESNMNCAIVLDCSASMNFRSEKTELSKFDYARRTAACLAYLMSLQGDRPAYFSYSSKMHQALSPGSGMKHCQELLNLISRESTGGKGAHRECLHQAASALKGRGLLIFISDFMEDEEHILEFLRLVRSSHTDCLVLQVLDPMETQLDLQGNIQFQDLETGQVLATSASKLQIDYRQKVQSYIDAIHQQCLKNQIDHLCMNSQTALENTLTHYLMRRQEAHL